MRLVLFTLVLVLDPSSSGVVSQGAGGVIASPEHNLKGGSFQAFFMAVHEPDECQVCDVETWRTQQESGVSLQYVMGHQCQAVRLELLLANQYTYSSKCLNISSHLILNIKRLMLLLFLFTACSRS